MIMMMSYLYGMIVGGRWVSLYAAWTITRGSEAVARRFSVEKVFLKISQKSQENTCARVQMQLCSAN